MCVNNICRTCKHWDVTHVDMRDSASGWMAYSMRCNKIRQTIEIEIDQGSGWDSGGASVEEVCTPAHFGCNHWEHWNPA
jgi:hypothetical protein